MSKIVESDILNNSVDVWKFLQTNGGLDIKYYDKGIVNDLRDILGFSPRNSIEKQLQNKSTSIEIFLQAFFTALNPFSQMFNDLLKLFESNSIKETNDSVLIKFDFQNEVDSLEFDLRQFQAWIKKWKTIRTKINLYKIKSEDLYRLSSIFNDFNQSYKINSNIDRDDDRFQTKETREWLELYFSNWPNNSSLILPKTKNQKLNDLLNNIQVIFNDVMYNMSLLGVSHSKLYSFLTESKEKGNDKIPDYALAEVDYWAGYFLKEYLILIYRINNNLETENVNLVRNLCNQLELYLSSIPRNNTESSAMIEELLDFLKLPIWKKRYDFYATWVLTRISAALINKRLKFHTTNGRLHFSFSGSHLATTKTTPELHIWSELRSSLENPIGKGRKSGIQPDYSIIIPPLTNLVESTLLVVECKQYRRPSKRNFNNALIDYANGRPNAEIILVNYGPTNNKILDEIEPTLRARTHIIGNMRPGNEQSIKEFKELVYKAIDFTINTDDQDTKDIFTSENVNIKLIWDKSPSDLDLHVFLKESNNSNYQVKVNHENMGNLSIKPFMKLDKDVINGFGPEVVKIQKLLPGKYLIAIHNFSNEQPLSTSNAKIEIEIDDKTFLFNCPTNGQGRWWTVLEASTIDREIIIHNKIGHDISLI
ncbi:hypothetical protein [Neobacillus kokaensis]|uniref:Uncharacterized protein n=1 Tax=Neobacillus kokaensis TaxID=2759023 RepID=A0ABQ3NAU5_9BACI|nr:hypothetical protein [Neobacillus kokaensis]GHI00632.1 hypothetical protein AM1BK_41740 [Neobacillus kokaensis]